MKAAIKHILSKFGFRIIRDVPGHSFTWRANHTENVEALELAILLCKKGRSTFRFIQIGAYDGVEADPLRPLIDAYHLEGLLIEPIPDVYQKLIENYSSEHQLVFANVAVGPSSGEMNLYRFRMGQAKGNANLHGLTTFDRSRLEKQAINLGLGLNEIETVSVPCLSLKEIIDKYNYEKFNLLCIDAEGMDTAILMSALNSGIKPEIVYMEILELPVVRRQQLFDLLSREGYKINATVSDLLAVKLGSIASL